MNDSVPTAPAALRSPYVWHPTSQTITLPAYTSDPNTLLTPLAHHAFGLQSVPAGLPQGILPWEITLAQLIAGRGYATACFGKWHRGGGEGR